MFCIEGFPQQVRMANLAVIGAYSSHVLAKKHLKSVYIGSRKVNGVAELHSQLVQSMIFPDFVEFYGKSKYVCWNSWHICLV